MLVLGLVHGGGWEPPRLPPDPPADEPPERRPWSWRPPWRPLAWFAAWCWLMALVPVASNAVSALAGFALLMLAFGLVCWRLERFCRRQYWHGLREYKY